VDECKPLAAGAAAAAERGKAELAKSFLSNMFSSAPYVPPVEPQAGTGSSHRQQQEAGAYTRSLFSST